MGIEVIINPLLTMASMVLLGYLCVKFKYIGPDLKNSLSSLMLHLTIPLLTITTISGQELNQDMLKNAGLVVVTVALLIVFMLLIGFLTARICRLPSATEAVHICMSAFSSIAFMGYPLIHALYGDTGLFYAAIAVPVYDIIFFTAGMFIIAKSAGGGIKQALKKLLNPVTISIVISLIMLVFKLRLPEILHNAFKTIGSMTTGLAMLFIGMTLACMNLKGIYKRFSIFLLALLKMLIIPALLALLLSYLSLDKMLIGVVTIAAAMPSQTILSAVSNEFGADTQYATEGVFITTVMCLVTLPLLYWFLLYII